MDYVNTWSNILFTQKLDGFRKFLVHQTFDVNNKKLSVYHQKFFTQLQKIILISDHINWLMSYGLIVKNLVEYLFYPKIRWHNVHQTYDVNNKKLTVYHQKISTQLQKMD